MVNVQKKKEKELPVNNLTKEWLCDTGEKLRFTFIDADSQEKFSPVAQCYGVCFNEKGEIAIGRNIHALSGCWVLPGGRPEKGETPEQTLKRELLEELDITIDKFKLLGAQKVESITEPNKEIYYQLRYAVIIKEIKPQTLDPDNGTMWERKFVRPEEVDKYLKWGVILKHLVKKAQKWYEKERKK